MNSDIATASAWTQADRDRQQTNIALNEVDAAIHEAVCEYRARRRANIVETRSLLEAERRILLRKANIALSRVGAQLARIEGPR